MEVKPNTQKNFFYAQKSVGASLFSDSPHTAKKARYGLDYGCITFSKQGEFVDQSKFLKIPNKCHPLTTNKTMD